MPDAFNNQQPSLTSPASSGRPITPDDIQFLSQTTRAIYVGVAGDIAVRMKSGEIVTFTDLQAGTLYPLRIDMVFATGTTASNLIALH